MVQIDHWFDGLSLLHRFEVSEGKVHYRNRFTSPNQEKLVKETGEFPLSFG
jgi:torulene dioxygenase